MVDGQAKTEAQLIARAVRYETDENRRKHLGVSPQRVHSSEHLCERCGFQKSEWCTNEAMDLTLTENDCFSVVQEPSTISIVSTTEFLNFVAGRGDWVTNVTTRK